MRRWTCTELFLMVLLLFFKVSSASAVSPDPRLLSLVPPSVRVIAGMKAPSSDGQPKSFMLVTPNNSIDLVDSIALAGAIHSRDRTADDASPPRMSMDLTSHILLENGRFASRKLILPAQRKL